MKILVAALLVGAVVRGCPVIVPPAGQDNIDPVVSISVVRPGGGLDTIASTHSEASLTDLGCPLGTPNPGQFADVYFTNLAGQTISIVLTGTDAGGMATLAGHAVAQGDGATVQVSSARVSSSPNIMANTSGSPTLANISATFPAPDVIGSDEEPVANATEIITYDVFTEHTTLGLDITAWDHSDNNISLPSASDPSATRVQVWDMSICNTLSTPP